MSSLSGVSGSDVVSDVEATRVAEERLEKQSRKFFREKAALLEKVQNLDRKLREQTLEIALLREPVTVAAREESEPQNAEDDGVQVAVEAIWRRSEGLRRGGLSDQQCGLVDEIRTSTESLMATLVREFEPSRRGPEAPRQKGDVELSILVVEDNFSHQFVATKLLKKIGFDADVASNGEEALDLIADKTYDLVFMDIEMPSMGGIAATRAIRGLDLERQPCIVAVTANTQAADREACLEAGMDGYLPKPVSLRTLEELMDRVRRWMVC